MVADNVIAIRDLLSRAGAAHGEYERTALNGVYDEQWHVWYAQWLVEHGFNDLVQKPLSEDELAALLYDLNTQYGQSDKQLHWAAFYAEKMATLLE